MGLSLSALALDPAMETTAVAVVLLVTGAGVGFATPALQTAAIESVPPEHAGAAAGLTSTSRYVGSIAGTYLLAEVLAPGSMAASGFGLLYGMLALCAAASVAAAMLVPANTPRRQARPARFQSGPANAPTPPPP